MAISPARTIAFDALLRVDTEGAYASDVLHAQLDPSAMETGKAKINPEDAALATELTLGVLRQRRLLDFLLERDLKKPISKFDIAVTLALRLGLYQLRFLERIPARAAVNESVEMVKRARKTSAAPLVNAVLRKAASEAKQPAAKFVPQNVSPSERIAILHSHPTWLVERWLARLGEPRTIALLEANNRAPQLSCAVHDASRRVEILNELEKTGLRIEPGQLSLSAFSARGGTVTHTDAFRRGAISIQDEASQIVPLLLGVHPLDRVLDLCAAPGGKTGVLAHASGENGLVIAADIHAHRLRAMRAQFERLHLPCVRLAQLDATHALPFGMKFDRILVDAPCSGTGTLGRHPEIRWRLKPEQLAEFQRLQVAILASAIDALAAGGRLVYSTCSLEPEENESVIDAVLGGEPSCHRLSPDAVSRHLAPHLSPGVEPSSLFDSAGYFRTTPGTQPTDGFFAAILEKSR
jgi:16S rRNA (cytosine967-C5)-methyltransferase